MPLSEKLSPNSVSQAEENCRRRQAEEPVCGLRTVSSYFEDKQQICYPLQSDFCHWIKFRGLAN